LKPQSYAPRADHFPSSNVGGGPQFLMCSPRYFGVHYSINPWMDPEAWSKGEGSLKVKAKRQWTSLHKALTSRGVDVTFLRCQPGLPDLVFTANAAVILDGIALLSRFRHPERQAEQPIAAAAFRRLVERQCLAAVFELPPNVTLEGAGDCIWDRHRRLFWVGRGPRSTRDAGTVVASCFGVETVSLELVDPRFYHLDTALCALPTGELIYYSKAFTEAGRREIEARVEPSGRLALAHEEATQIRRQRGLP
jgi:N-dimethylarginine dimethylaminohydrolase